MLIISIWFFNFYTFKFREWYNSNPVQHIEDLKAQRALINVIIFTFFVRIFYVNIYEFNSESSHFFPCLMCIIWVYVDYLEFRPIKKDCCLESELKTNFYNVKYYYNWSYSEDF
jgi:hypothetical protein